MDNFNLPIGYLYREIEQLTFLKNKNNDEKKKFMNEIKLLETNLKEINEKIKCIQNAIDFLKQSKE